MKATTYRSLSNRKEIVTVRAGQSVAQAFPQINFENAVVIVNGEEVAADYILKEHDVVTIRELPGMAGAAIALAAALVVGSVYCGIQLYKAKKAAEEAQEEIEKIKKQTNRDDIDNRPFLRGASNTAAREKSQPYICGRHLFTPYLLCSPFYRLSGEDGKDQYTYIALECGFNKQIIDSVSIDDVTIKKFADSEPQEGAYALDGGQVFADEGVIEIAQDGGLLTELDELNYKTVSTACNAEIPRDCKVDSGDAEYLTYTLDANALNVEVAISFPYGLYAYNDDSKKIKTKVTITPQYSTDGGSSWTDFRFSSGNTFNRDISSKELRFRAVKKFSLDDYRRLRACGQNSILLRVRSDGSDDTKIKNDCYVLYYQSRCFDPNKSSYPAGVLQDNGEAGLVPCKIIEDRERAFCTVMGLRIKAGKNNEDKLSKINVITQGVARIWNGSKWSGAKSATRNAAAWALEILTSESHPMSRFSDEEIDLESFGELYEWCEKNEFYFDYVITQGRKKSDTLNLILGNCGALLYWDLYGRLAVAIDRPQENAIAVYNPQNIIGISNKKTFGRRTDGVRVKYVSSRDDLFSEDTYLLMREVNGKPLELNADSAIKDVTVSGITEYRHVVKYARRLMAIEALRPKTTTIEVGNEGVYFTPYSKILLQDDSLKIGTGSGVIKAAQWTDGRLSKIVLDSYVTFESGKRYGVIINCFGDKKAVPIPLRVSGDGYTDTLTVETPISDTAAAVPEAGCVASFGELDAAGNFGKITTPYMISGITRSDKGFRLELVNYDEAIYRTGTIPDYRSNITQKPSVSQAAIPGDFVTKDEMIEAIVNGIDTSSEPPDTPVICECKAYQDCVSARFSALPDEEKNTLKTVEWQVDKGSGWEDFASALAFYARYDFVREVDGYPEAEDLDWQFRCRVTNVAGMKSEWSAPRIADTAEYGTWRVSSAKDASAKVYGSDVIVLSFSGRRPNSRQYYGRTRFAVIVKYDGEPIRTETDIPGSLYYYFDRAADGYPERHENASGGVRDLSLYSFTIRPVEAVTGEQGEDVEVGFIDVQNYLTWLIPEVSAAATAGEHRISLSCTLASRSFYGNILYDIYLDGKAIAEGVSSPFFTYRFEENLERADLERLSFGVRVRNEAHERTEAFDVDFSGYLGYKIGKPEITAAAQRDGISVSWKRSNDFYGKCEYVLLKDGIEVFSSARETEFFLKFGDDEFPEKADIEKIDLRVRIDGDADSATSDAAEIDASGYLTYIPAVPKVYPSASGRSANLSWDAQDGVYGFAGCEIQIAKAYKVVDGKCVPVVDDSELEWYAPALGLNPYASLDNYRKGDAGGRLEVRGTSVSFSLPLFGQDEDGAADTQYAFRLRGRSEAGKVSEWTEALYLTCRAISAHDVVRAWDLDDKGERVRLDGALGARQIFAEELAAISANLGYITDGALRGNAYNYWAVSDTPMDDGSILRRGSFRVGGKDQYILVEPRLGASGEPTGEYDITFVVGNYSVSASGTQIRGGAFEVYDGSGNLIFHTGADGNKIRVAEGQFSSTESEADVPDNETEEVPSYEPSACPLITYDGELYFIRYGTYNKKVTTQIWKLPKNSLDNAEKYMEIKNLLYSNVVSPYALSPIASTDGKVKIPGKQRGNSGIFEINLGSKKSDFTQDSAGVDGLPYMNFSNSLFFVADDTLYRMTSSGSGVSCVYHYGNYETAFCGGKAAGNNAYFLVAHGLATLIIRVDLTTGQLACVFLTAVVLEAALGESYANSFSVSEDAISIFGQMHIGGDDGTFSSPTARQTCGILRVPFSNAVWNEMTGAGDGTNDIIVTGGTVPELYDTHIDTSDSNSGKTFAAVPYLDALDGVYGILTDTTAGKTVRRLVRIVPQEQAEPVSHVYYTLMGSASFQTVKDFPVADDERSEQNIQLYLYGLSVKSVSQTVDGIPSYSVLAPYYQAGSSSPVLRLYTTLMDEKRQITGSKVYSAGIGFTAIYYDSTSKKYRYYLDTGAYLEFDENGRLVV